MIRAIITDIEGTTSSLDFVKQTLFPYARERMEAFVYAHLEDPQVRQALDETDAAVDRLLNVDEAIQQLISWIDEDRKITPLKTLQGRIWEAGYRRGDLQGHVYPDAVAQMRQWQADALPVYLYSSGSVAAQKLLFGHTAYGDLNGLFRGCFDTRIGAKTEAESYRRISAQIGTTPTDCLFLSDAGAELDAARTAGMASMQLLRDGAIRAIGHPAVEDFSSIVVR